MWRSNSRLWRLSSPYPRWPPWHGKILPSTDEKDLQSTTTFDKKKTRSKQEFFSNESKSNDSRGYGSPPTKWSKKNLSAVVPKVGAWRLSPKKNTIRNDNYDETDDNNDEDPYNHFGTEVMVEDESIHSSSNGTKIGCWGTGGANIFPQSRSVSWKVKSQEQNHWNIPFLDKKKTPQDRHDQ